MKKFLVLSAIVGLAGLGVGLAGRQDDPAAIVVETAGEATTTTTAAPVETSSTTAPKAAAKVAPKVTTTTRPPAMAVPTTVTTRAPVATSTTMATTTTTAPAPRCSLTAQYPSLEMGRVQTIRFESKLVKPEVTFTMSRAGTIVDTYTSRTSVGYLPWTFVNEGGMNVDMTISADVRPDGGSLLTNLCSTTYRSLRRS